LITFDLGLKWCRCSAGQIRTKPKFCRQRFVPNSTRFYRSPL